MKDFDIKGLANNNVLCIKALTSAREILYSVIGCYSLAYEVEKIEVALRTISNVLNARPDMRFDYRDILEEEHGYLKNKEVPYISGIDGKKHLLPYECITEDTLNTVVYSDGVISYLPEIGEYSSGNEAIGQVYINDNMGYCIGIAVEHSLRSTVYRWHDFTLKLLRIFERM